jgi:hypothetical protein
MLRISHSLDIRLTDDGEVISLMSRTSIYSQETFLYVFGTNFCSRLTKPQRLVRPEGRGQFMKITHLIGPPNPGSSDMYFRALTTTLQRGPTECPIEIT